jgi:hypothetical protein
MQGIEVVRCATIEVPQSERSAADQAEADRIARTV